ncbi:MAG: hypothetical protein V4466_09870 [Pseudomonadota bacterium]
MNGLRKAVYLAMSFAALAASIAILSTTARSQTAPFGALSAPVRGGPTPSSPSGLPPTTPWADVGARPVNPA